MSRAFYDPYFVTARMETGAYIVDLDSTDMANALSAGSGRHSDHDDTGRVDPSYRGAGQGARNDDEGGISEVAAQVLLADRSGQLVYPHAEWLARRERGLTDVRGIEVRATSRGAFGFYDTHERRSLIIHKDSKKDNKKTPDTPYILAVVMCEHRKTIVDKPIFTGRVVFPGWCLWAEATTWGDWLPVEDWCRVEADLRPMPLLLERLGIKHPTVDDLLDFKDP